MLRAATKTAGLLKRSQAPFYNRPFAAVISGRVLLQQRTSHVRYSTDQQQGLQAQDWGPPDALSADDRLAIIDLCNCFDRAVNRGEQASLAQFFAPDAEVHHPKGTVAGAGAIVAYFLAMAPFAAGKRHLTCNVIIEAAGADGRRARASAYRLLHAAASPPTLLASGTIEDELVKSAADGRWRFAARRLVMDVAPASAPPQQQ